MNKEVIKTYEDVTFDKLIEVLANAMASAGERDERAVRSAMYVMRYGLRDALNQYISAQLMQREAGRRDQTSPSTNQQKDNNNG